MRPCDENVFNLQVPMHNSFRVKPLQSGRNLNDVVLDLMKGYTLFACMDCLLVESLKHIIAQWFYELDDEAPQVRLASPIFNQVNETDYVVMGAQMLKDFALTLQGRFSLLVLWEAKDTFFLIRSSAPPNDFLATAKGELVNELVAFELSCARRIPGCGHVDACRQLISELSIQKMIEIT